MIDYEFAKSELSRWLDSEEGIRVMREVEGFYDRLAIDLAKGREYQPWMDSWVATC